MKQLDPPGQAGVHVAAAFASFANKKNGNMNKDFIASNALNLMEA
ncbi:hypothetical protein AB1A81_02420 [Bdellovibrio bacteriovorus]|uniref:Uncharacterized protein n=1 Tax=Bdellovibrio bacteriovorus (strain ATCC 15356 / DSM 50701 / NCIMB 9529 / HD100) TaxID=264462 RepID=Q6MQE5_BDEBA|nr:hypothetical protein [Bdellovibrio bacteriovorus]CAE78502.1 hypothetical protein predicted by Glimmer/Critica [Bdellovibrio bacteriovorus HD100]